MSLYEQRYCSHTLISPSATRTRFAALSNRRLVVQVSISILSSAPAKHCREASNADKGPRLPREAQQARSAGIPRGEGRTAEGAVTPPLYGGLGTVLLKNNKFKS